MKLKDTFISRNFGGDYILVATEQADFKGIINANMTAGFIIDCLKTDTTREQIIDKMLRKYNAQSDIIMEDVDNIIEALRGIDAIEE